jgi:hypothetical protein
MALGCASFSYLLEHIEGISLLLLVQKDICHAKALTGKFPRYSVGNILPIFSTNFFSHLRIMLYDLLGPQMCVTYHASRRSAVYNRRKVLGPSQHSSAVFHAAAY